MENCNWETDPTITEVEAATWHILGRIANREITAGDADLYFYMATHDGESPNTYRNRHGGLPYRLPPDPSEALATLLEAE